LESSCACRTDNEDRARWTGLRTAPAATKTGHGSKGQDAAAAEIRIASQRKNPRRPAGIEIPSRAGDVRNDEAQQLPEPNRQLIQIKEEILSCTGLNQSVAGQIIQERFSLAQHRSKTRLVKSHESREKNQVALLGVEPDARTGAQHPHGRSGGTVNVRRDQAQQQRSRQESRPDCWNLVAL
jgi:hypothetical protein